MQGENGWDYNFDILPTYSAMGWYGTESYFPLEMAEEFAGGNGFNGKPVLQFTYQFTDSNNGNLGGFNPSFDILRGRYDDQFRRLAQDIKSYGKPVLFRLNNEMNSDWTSYSGICALLDPDIFRMTWSRLYGIFEEEGRRQHIWIFNPHRGLLPVFQLGRGAQLYARPSQMQALGLTYYEMGNGASLMSLEICTRRSMRSICPTSITTRGSSPSSRPAAAARSCTTRHQRLPRYGARPNSRRSGSPICSECFRTTARRATSSSAYQGRNLVLLQRLRRHRRQDLFISYSTSRPS